VDSFFSGQFSVVYLSRSLYNRIDFSNENFTAVAQKRDDTVDSVLPVSLSGKMYQNLAPSVIMLMYA